jgi:hypothetical protein
VFFVCALCVVGGRALSQQYRLLGANDLGMHCMDKEYSVFSILPPFNVVGVQVVKSAVGSSPILLDSSTVDVTYEPVADGAGSYNSTSLAGKTQFWTYVEGLFHVKLPPGQGLTGLYMPADAPTPGPQPLSYDPPSRSFRAFGIPITPIDDAQHVNAFPLMRFAARDSQSHALLAWLDVVVPVASETDCGSCHATGQIGAQNPSVPWSNDADLEVQAKRNVLILHDHRQGTHLMNSQPVLCASCHVSPPLQIGDSVAATLGGTGVGTGSTHGAPPHSPMRPVRRVEAARFMSVVMHDYHGRLHDSSGNPVFPPNGTPEQTCYTCHPGAITQCLRGAMKTGGMECFSCHGDMLAVGGAHPLLAGGSIDGQNDGHSRRPWKDVPRCQSCHTGDALSHLSGPAYAAAPDGLRLRQAWLLDDESASAIKATNQRFAENLNAQYRASKGHGELSCEACHGSTHAEWPNADPTHNDNVAAMQLQGHNGPIIECGTCHASLAPTTGGPHGLHNVNSLAFVRDHDHFYESNPAGCQACHGTNLLGTVLSRAAANRTFHIEDDLIVNIAKGTQVRCNMCHSMPGSDDD